HFFIYVYIISLFFIFFLIPPPPKSTLFPYTTLFRSTFMTPTGDYRFLEGSAHDSTIRLSTFDGNYSYLFNGSLKNDGRIYGEFRSEEHTSELQSRENLVCRLLLEKKKKNKKHN